MASGSDRRPATADGSWVVWTLVGIAGIWVAVTLISLLAPDMVTGVSPVAAALLTTLGGIAAGVLSRPPEPG
jgi:hypothetical protein